MSQDTLSNAQQEIQSPSLQEVLIPIWANRKRILTISFAVALVTLGVNFLLPVYYKSTATLLPETQKDKLSALGQFADIASLAGVSVPGSEIAKLYPTIIKSQTILRRIILKKYKTEEYPDSVNLIEYFDYADLPAEVGMVKTLAKVEGLLTVNLETKTSVVLLSLELPEPRFSAEVLNAIINELDHFMRNKRTTSASEQVKWIELRLQEVSRELRDSEEKLKTFRERNRRPLDSPELILQQERFLRDIQVKSTVFIELKKQHELAKLEEIKNITIVNVLDPGRVPVKKERPKRATNAAIAFLLCLVSLSAYYGSEKILEDAKRKYIDPVRDTLRTSKTG